MNRCYVDVITYIREDGKIAPLCIVWKENKYTIDKVLKVQSRIGHAGADGMLFTCKIAGRLYNLYWDGFRWCCEAG